jgi:hypothetical protein
MATPPFPGFVDSLLLIVDLRLPFIGAMVARNGGGPPASPAGSRRNLWTSTAAALGAAMILLGCSGESKEAGEACEDDDECPAGLACTFQECARGPVVSYCTVECETSGDCDGFAEPSCALVSGLTMTCIEEGQNPCER